jgi:N-acetylmuramoyl-L-alanine amidase
MVHRIIPHIYKWAHSLGRRIGKPPYIIVHISASGPKTTVDDIDAWHKANDWAGIGYHAVVYPTGKIVRGRPVWAMGAHCLGHNECLGVCFISEAGKITQEQIDSGRWLIHRWRHRFDIPVGRVKRHRDMSGNSTSCPGVLPMSKVR